MKWLIRLVLGSLVLSLLILLLWEPPTFGDATSVMLNSVAKDQSDFFKANGKYKYVKGAGYTVHEYVTPKGEVGYNVIYEDAEHLYSKGYGAEADERTYTYTKPVITNVASTTP